MERDGSGPSGPPAPAGTIGDCFDRVAAALPDREALVSCHQRLRYTYGALQAEADLCARGLLAFGLQPGDRIGLWSPSAAEGVITQLAAAKAGALLISLDPACGATELYAVLSGCRISLLIFAPSLQSGRTGNAAAMLGTICPELGASPRGQLHSPALPALRTAVALGLRRPSGAYNWGDLRALAEQVPPATLHTRQGQQDAADPVAILLPDGAAGPSQGVSVSHQRLLAQAVVEAEGTALSAQDRLCLALPLSHPLSMAIGTVGCLTQGAALVLPSAAADPASVLAAIQEERCTAVLDLRGVRTIRGRDA